MNTTYATPKIFAPAPEPTIAELEHAVDEALENLNEARRAACKVTVEDGYTFEQQEAAYRQELAADAIYRQYYRLLDSRKAVIIRTQARIEAAEYCAGLNAAFVTGHPRSAFGYRFQGNNKMRKVMAIASHLRRYAIPYSVTAAPEFGVVIQF